MKGKTPLLHNQMHNKKASADEVTSEKLLIPLSKKKLRSFRSEGAVFHNVLYYQQFPFACYAKS